MELARKAGLWDYVIHISFRICLDQPGVIGPGAQAACLPEIDCRRIWDGPNVHNNHTPKPDVTLNSAFLHSSKRILFRLEDCLTFGKAVEPGRNLLRSLRLCNTLKYL
jgi:hypothetical protein